MLLSCCPAHNVSVAVVIVVVISIVVVIGIVVVVRTLNHRQNRVRGHRAGSNNVGVEACLRKK